MLKKSLSLMLVLSLVLSVLPAVHAENAVSDGMILLPGGTFLMGSPETERMRQQDEVQHEVTVSPFYVDAYETTQTEYERLMGGNPSTFRGDRLCRMM